MHTGQVNGHRVSFAYLPVGAPGTVMMMEEMIASGARVFVGFGYCGSLQEHLQVGNMIIPTSCIIEEGTSPHYSNNNSSGPSPRLAGILKQACEEEGFKPETGPVWTTDAPYRETIEKITQYHDQGILGVDMETSAMYTLGHLRSIEVCNLLLVSDELYKKWDPAFGSQRLRDAAESARKVILRSLNRISTLQEQQE